MRQLRFISIAFLTFLCVINAVFWRKAIAVLLCGVLSFNSASAPVFLNQDEIANAAVPLNRTPELFQSDRPFEKVRDTQTSNYNPLIASETAASSTTPQYDFNLVAKEGLTTNGQKIQHIEITIPWQQHRLIDEKGQVVFQDWNNRTIFRDNQAIAFVGQKIGNYSVKEVEGYFLFKDGTLDVLLKVGDPSPYSYGHSIIIRENKILVENIDGLLEVVPGYPDTYYVMSASPNRFFLKNGVTEVAEKPKPKTEPNLPYLQDSSSDACVRNDKNQRVCGGNNFGYLVREGKKYLPGIGQPLAINNNGRIITNFMQVLDYEGDALTSEELALKKSGNSELEEIKRKNNYNLSTSDMSNPIFAKANIPHRIQIPYTKLLGTTFNSLVDRIRYLQLTDSGYMAIVLDFGNGIIIRAKPSGSTTAKAEPDQCLDTTIKPTDDAKAIIQKFREKFASDDPNCRSKSPWEGITEDAEAIADRLDKLIADSSLIDQGPLNVCGPAAFFYLWFKNDPKSAILYATKLYEKGESKIGNIDVHPGKLVKSGNYNKVRDKIPAADWMMLSALRNSENNASYFSGTPEDAASAFTLPWEIKRWLNATKLYRDVLLYTLPKKVSEYPNASKKDGEVDWNKLIQDFSNLNDKDIILLLDGTRLPGNPPNTFPFPNHYIVLTSPMSLEQNKKEVKLSYWTWGKIFNSETFGRPFIETISPIMAIK